MRVLFDAAHGADVWVLGAVEDRLVAGGATTAWLSRPGKEAVVELLDAQHRRHTRGPRAARTAAGLATELVRRDLAAHRLVRRFRPDVVVTRSPAGVHAARLARIPVLYDTDDGDVAGLLYRVAGPLADLVTSPAAVSGPAGPRHRPYRGYKELCHLHPRRFAPDPAVRAELGLAPGEPLFVVRLTAFTASHDRGHVGLTPGLARHLVGRLRRVGRVVVSSESPLPPDLAPLALPAAPHRFPHVLAAAALVVGDSQTVCAEAAVLGVPSIRCSSWVGRHPYLVELEQRWQLHRTFSADDTAGLLAAVEAVRTDPTAAKRAAGAARDRMLAWAEDPLDIVIDAVDELVGAQDSTTDGGVTAVQASGFWARR